MRCIVCGQDHDRGTAPACCFVEMTTSGDTAPKEVCPRCKGGGGVSDGFHDMVFVCPDCGGRGFK